MIIEDNLDDFYLLNQMLESSEEIQAEVWHECRLEQAILTAQATKIDAVVIDLCLPDSIGLDTFIYFHENFPLIPAIVITGSKDKCMALEAVQKGAQDYLIKGEFSISAIARTLRYAIERHRMMVELKYELDKVKFIKELLPICSGCKKIRDAKGDWSGFEEFILKNTPIKLTHTMCPECVKNLYPWFNE